MLGSAQASGPVAPTGGSLARAQQRGANAPRDVVGIVREALHVIEVDSQARPGFEEQLALVVPRISCE
jgi:hypothetical protein